MIRTNTMDCDDDNGKFHGTRSTNADLCPSQSVNTMSVSERLMEQLGLPRTLKNLDEDCVSHSVCGTTNFLGSVENYEQNATINLANTICQTIAIAKSVNMHECVRCVFQCVCIKLSKKW